MIVTLDVGNTNFRLGVVRGGDVMAARRAATRTVTTADSAERVLDGLLAQDGTALARVELIVLASVVPRVSAALAEVAQRHGIRLIVAEATTIPMPLRVEQPTTVGHDRLVNAFAAALLYGTPAIVVDLGTATTFDVVAPDGAFVGGAIAPGIALGLDALAERTAQLPRVPLEAPDRAIGRDTMSAMQSGAVLGYVDLVSGLLDRMRAELEQRPKVILTGGLATLPWARAIPGVDAIDSLLTLRGLALLERELAARPKMAHTKA